MRKLLKSGTSRRDRKRVMVPITVKDLMTAGVITLTPEDSLRALRDLLAAKTLRHVPITDGNGILLGLVTQRDFLTVAVSKLADIERSELDEIYGRILIRDVMGKKVTTVSPDMPLGEAASIMFQNKYGCLPVVESGRLSGILTEADFVKAFAQAERREAVSDCLT